MNMQSNAIPDSPIAAQRLAPVIIPEGRLLYWSVLREVWENRSIYIAPLAVAGLILIGFLIGTIHLPGKVRAALALDPMQLHELLVQPFDFAALFIMGTTFIVALFYSVDALYGERRDRSILFWKSLPVSDLTTVLSKAAIPLVVLPLLTFAITVLTQLTMVLIGSVVLTGSGVSIATLWTQLSLLQTWGGLLYHLVAIHSLWYAPIFGWLLLVSAWARRAPILWAVMPPLAIALVEKIAFNTTHFVTMLGDRLEGGPEAVTMPGGSPMDPMTHFTPGHLLASPGLWIGLALTAAFHAGAIRLRRSQGPV
jgi:ABC-2 type transport system permease protein